MRQIVFAMFGFSASVVASFAQQYGLNDTIAYREFQFPLTEADTKMPFVYFNDEWIPGAGVDMVTPEQIMSIEVKDDEYANRAMFITVSQETLESIKVDARRSSVVLEPICEFPGGNGQLKTWIDDNIQVPESLSGTTKVTVGMKIMPDGTISDTRILRPSDNGDANQEAMRLVGNLPKFRVKYFTPRKFPLNYCLPITFTAPGTIFIR